MFASRLHQSPLPLNLRVVQYNCEIGGGKWQILIFHQFLRQKNNERMYRSGSTWILLAEHQAIIGAFFRMSPCFPLRYVYATGGSGGRQAAGEQRAPGQSSEACRVAMPASPPLFSRSKRPAGSCLGHDAVARPQGSSFSASCCASTCPKFLRSPLRPLGARFAEPRKDRLTAHGCVTERAAVLRLWQAPHPAGMAAAIVHVGGSPAGLLIFKTRGQDAPWGGVRARGAAAYTRAAGERPTPCSSGWLG